MEIFMVVLFILAILFAIFFSYLNVKYFMTMWRFKNRKKDGSEDKYFKMFD